MMKTSKELKQELNNLWSTYNAQLANAYWGDETETMDRIRATYSQLKKTEYLEKKKLTDSQSVLQ